ncbi:CPBP family intramembrane metalloprotease [Mycobacterium sp. NBC_00419]
MTWRPVLRATAGTAVALAVGAPLGLRPPQLWSGLRHGGAAAVAVAAGVAATTLVPSVRTAMRERAVPDSARRWLAFEIPLGTVVFEEALFRGALASVAGRGFGPAIGRLVQAGAFGLWHIPDARRAGESVVGTVLVTGLAGWGFGWLAERSGSVVAPMLAHLAVNEAGAIAALAVRGR